MTIPENPLEGEATPARSATNLTAVGKSHLLTFLTSSAASPPIAQTQQRHVFRFKSTWKLGSWSSWNVRSAKWPSGRIGLPMATSLSYPSD